MFFDMPNLVTGRRRFLTAAAAIAGTSVLPSFTRSVHGQEVPNGYPAEYADIVRAGRAEGRIVIYTNMSNNNWAPVSAAFRKRYPDIQIDILELGGSESVTRYLAEASTGVGTADLIVTAQQGSWLDIAGRGEVLPYESPESGVWPDWTMPAKGVYTASADPLFFAWNKLLVPDATRPKSFAEFSTLVESDPSKWQNKVTTYNATNTWFGYSSHWFFIKHHGEAGWDMLRKLGSLPVRFEATGGPMLEKVTSGEYSNAYFVSGIQVWPRLTNPVTSRFLGWNFIADGQPMMVRGMGIPLKARNANAAKLLLDFCLSKDGQHAFGLGGVTPVRPDLKPSADVPHTFNSIAEEIGMENVIVMGFDPDLMKGRDEFLARMAEAYKV